MFETAKTKLKSVYTKKEFVIIYVYLIISVRFTTYNRLACNFIY